MLQKREARQVLTPAWTDPKLGMALACMRCFFKRKYLWTLLASQLLIFLYLMSVYTSHLPYRWTQEVTRSTLSQGVSTDSGIPSLKQEDSGIPSLKQEDSGIPSLSKCVIPQLKSMTPEVKQFFKTYPRLHCDTDKMDWVLFHKGKFIIQSEAEKKVGPITCKATPVLWNGDRAVKHGATVEMTNGTALKHDFYKVDCTSKSGKTYYNVQAGIPLQPEKEQDSNPIHVDIPLNVLILGYDSMSHQAFIRNMPATRELLFSKMGAIEMNGYNIMGDGTPAALIPLLVGQKEGETFEIRRGYPGEKMMDGLPFLWKEFQKAGYVTSYNEDHPIAGVFQLRMTGFDQQPVDHYLRTYSMETSIPHNGLCMGARTYHKAILDYAKEIFLTYPSSRRKFVFVMHSIPSHRDNNQMSQLDEELAEYLQSLDTEGFLNDTLLIVMADHGARFARLRTSKQGTLEEKLPYFSFRFPPWFEKEYPQAIANLRWNTDVLTSPLDIHETLSQFLKFTGTDSLASTNGGASLFKKLPKDRDCKSARVGPHWCSCLQWVDADVKSDVIQKAATAAVEKLNGFTSKYRNKCVEYSLKEVTAGASLTMLAQDPSGEHGASPKPKDSSGTPGSPHTTSYFQLTLTTNPGGGKFQVTLTQDSLTREYTLYRDDVSRVNAYGSTSNCILAHDIQLREICYCK